MFCHCLPLFCQTCEGSLDWNYSRDQKRGLAWITSLRCDICGYQSPPRKLYEEVKSPGPGRKAARLNLAMSVGRMGTCLTTEGMRAMLLSANIHPGSASSMQETANKVGEKILSRPPRLYCKRSCRYQHRKRKKVGGRVHP